MRPQIGQCSANKIPKSGDARRPGAVENALYVARLGGSRGRAKLRRPLDVGLPPTTPSTRSRNPMNVRKSRLARLVALTVVVSMPLVGMAGAASAKVKGAPNCTKHVNRAKCKAGGGGGTGGPNPPPPNIIVTVSPDPVQEVGTSEVD